MVGQNRKEVAEKRLLREWHSPSVQNVRRTVQPEHCYVLCGVGLKVREVEGRWWDKLHNLNGSREGLSC